MLDTERAPTIEETVKGDSSAAQEMGIRHAASHLVREAMVVSGSNSLYDLSNHLSNSEDSKDKQLSGFVGDIIRQAKYINGSEAGAVDTDAGSRRWSDALNLSEALFYNDTLMQTLQNEIEQIEAKSHDNPAKEELRQKVLLSKAQDLESALQADRELRVRADATRDERTSNTQIEHVDLY